MLAQPRTYRCTVLIQQVEPDAAVPDKYHFEGELLSSEEAASGNSFFAGGRDIKGFAFNLPENITSGTKVKADVEFMGDPFIQNYELKNVEPET